MSQYNMTTNQSTTSASPEDQQRFLSLIPTLLPIAAQLVQSFGNRDISQTSRATTPLTGMPSSPEDQQRSWGSFLQQALPIASQLMQSFGSRDISSTPGLAAPSTGMPSSPEDQQRFLITNTYTTPNCRTANSDPLVKIEIFLQRPD